MPNLTLNDVRSRYLAFFAARDHVEIPSASLIPENDPTTLFTGSGMQPLLPNLLGQPHPKGNMLADSQKCFRSNDIEEVGDNRHTTFFEMLGNWSLGAYFKRQQLQWIFEFLTDNLELNPEKLYVTVFGGDEEANIPRDLESASIWEELFLSKGIPSKTIDLSTVGHASAVGTQNGHIFFYDAAENWWSRSGPPSAMPVGEPGGPDSEIFYEFETQHDKAFGKHCHPNCDCGRFMEIGNNVFMEYLKQEDGSFTALPNKNVDFGGGLERITAAANNMPDIFELDVFRDVFEMIREGMGGQYQDAIPEKKAAMRIIADHTRAAVFLIGDGIMPGNKEQPYIVRRLIRRALLKTRQIFPAGALHLHRITDRIIDTYDNQYPGLNLDRKAIHDAFEGEEMKFSATLNRGLKEYEQFKIHKVYLTGSFASSLASTYGFPLEITKEIAEVEEFPLSKNFDAELRLAQSEHKEVSRKGLDQKFKGGLADHSDMSVKYHTATHLLHQALRLVLGDHVLQKGSNITPKRLRFDFSHPDKMTDEQKQAVEDLVNEQITAAIPVTREEMTVAEAKAQGALGLFEDKYANSVHVYKVGDFSIEICGGPHVSTTGTLGIFRITKEASASAGVRRIKAVLEGSA